MKRRFTGLFKLIAAVAFITLYCVYTQSCANTSGAPSGGPKDTIPPLIVARIPDTVLTNFPTLKGKITLTFNEYVQLKNQSQEVYLSPPTKKRVTAKVKSRSVVVTFNDTLRPDQTYTLSFGGAISDVNEGNPFPNYVYTFSTGDTLDSLLISGTVMDYETLLPKKGVTVALYQNPEDSTVMKDIPLAIAKSDDWGYFCVRGLKSVPYTIYAFEDKNNNFLYDKGAELAGFCDSVITPSIAAREGLPQIQQIDMKDTLACLARPSQTDIYIFKEKPDRQYLSNSGRVSERECFVKFNASGVQIDTFQIKGIYSDKIIKQFNEEGDSLTFWINDQRTLADTLLLRINYMRTDSLGTLSPYGQTLKLVKPFDKSKVERKRNQGTVRSYAESLSDVNTNGTVNRQNQNRGRETEPERAEKKEREDLLKMKLAVEGATVENQGISLTFPTPLIHSKFDSLIFTSTTPRKITSDVKYHVVRDSANILKYYIIADEAYKAGNDYLIKIPQKIFTDINGYTNDSTEQKFSLPNNDKLSSITLEIKNVNGGRYIVELVNEKRDKVFLKHVVRQDSEITFPYLNAGNYSFRITEDKNGNGKLDIGDILKRIPAEKARLLKLSDGKTLIELKEQTDLTQTLDLEELFK